MNLTRLPKCEQIHSAVFPEHISLLEFSLYAIFSQNHMLHFSELKSLRLTFTNAIFASIGTFTPTNLVTPASCPGRAEQSAAVSSAFRLFSSCLCSDDWCEETGGGWWRKKNIESCLLSRSDASCQRSLSTGPRSVLTINWRRSGSEQRAACL